MVEFEQIYAQHAPAVLRYARRCLGREDIAEEIAGDAFLELYRNRDKIDAGQLPAWLLTVVKNRSIDYWRRNKLETRYIGARLAEPPSLGPEPGAGLFEMTALKPVHRLCLTLRYVHGMTREEIAGFTGLRETQVKGYLKYGLTLLRNALAGKERTP